MRPLRVDRVLRVFTRDQKHYPKKRAGILIFSELTGRRVEIVWDDDLNSSRFTFELNAQQVQLLLTWLTNRQPEQVIRSASKAEESVTPSAAR